MQQTELFDIEISNPCIGICQSGARGYCKGCLRSREERFYWDSLKSQQKLKVITLCEMRKKKLNSKKMKLAEEKLLAEIILQEAQPEQLSFFDES